ncbi:MAG: hypothetical protein KGI38_00260 [Thaumarchaeota archaeon]|nr:hypothetical protein [Nitrososphaerota archaeon]
MGPTASVAGDILPNQSLFALLALVGARRMEVGALRERTRLAPAAFGSLLGWLQREYLVDVVSTLEGDQIEEKAVLTEKGEAVLVGMLESTCELLELH